MNYTAYKDKEVIISVKSNYSKEYIGIYIKTNYDTYKFCIDPYNNCCENFGVQLVDYNNKVVFDIVDKDIRNLDCGCGYDYELLKDYILKKIEYCHDRSSSNVDEGTLSLKLILKNNESNELVYYIDIYNYHNGYYPHEYLVEWNSYINEGTL